MGEKFYTYVTAILLAGLGGLLVSVKHGQHKLGQLFVAAVTSAFVGLLAAMALKSFGVDPDLIGAVAGVVGWLGADFIMGLLSKRLEKEVADESD